MLLQKVALHDRFFLINSLIESVQHKNRTDQPTIQQANSQLNSITNIITYTGYSPEKHEIKDDNKQDSLIQEKYKYKASIDVQRQYQTKLLYTITQMRKKFMASASIQNQDRCSLVQLHSAVVIVALRHVLTHHKQLQCCSVLAEDISIFSKRSDVTNGSTNCFSC